MQGIAEPDSERGIIPRAFDQIFDTVTVAENTKYLIRASYLEIYNEDIRDLLGKDTKARLELKERPEGGVFVKDLSMHPCSCVKECASVMVTGWGNRAVGSTLMNSASSRSHSIFTIHLERCDDPVKDRMARNSGSGNIRASKLNLVDLAGSERQDKTQATGDRFKEATKINLSLSALGNVISALVDAKAQHIPYRDSKLTRLLQDSLGGNTKTLMVACLSPADNNYEESLSTLRYANRAKNIKNKPKINEDPKDAMIREYLNEIISLKAMLDRRTPSVGLPESTTTRLGSTAEAVESVHDDQIKSLAIELEVAKTTKEEVTFQMKKVREDADKREHEQQLHTEKLTKETRVLKKQYDKCVMEISEELVSVKSGKEQVQNEMILLQVKFEEQLKAIEDVVLPEKVKVEKARLKEEFEREILAMKDELDSVKQSKICVNEEMSKLRQSFQEVEERAACAIDPEKIEEEKRKFKSEHEQIIQNLRKELEDVQRCRDSTLSDMKSKELIHDEEIKAYALKPVQIEAEKLSLKLEYEKNIQDLQSELDALKQCRDQKSEEILIKDRTHEDNLRLLEEYGERKSEIVDPVNILDNTVLSFNHTNDGSKSRQDTDIETIISKTKVASEISLSPEIEDANQEINTEYEAHTNRKIEESDYIRTARDVMAKKINHLKIEYQKAIKLTEITIVLPERLAEEKSRVKSTFEMEMSLIRDQLAEIKDSRAAISREVKAKSLVMNNYKAEMCRLRCMLNSVKESNIAQLNEAAMHAQIIYDSALKHTDLMLHIEKEQVRVNRLETDYERSHLQIDDDVRSGNLNEDAGDREKVEMMRRSISGTHTTMQRQTELFEKYDNLQRDASANELRNAYHPEGLKNIPKDLNSLEAAKRLDELQRFLIGGDVQTNVVEAIKEKLFNEKQHAEKKRFVLERALVLENESRLTLGDGSNGVHDGMISKSSAVRSLKLENEALRQEVKDLQCEFQYDRVDYLETLRAQDQTIKWYEATVAKILPALRRDANYVDLDRMKVQSVWDDLNQRWKVPEFKIEKMTLPSLTGRRASSAMFSCGFSERNSPFDCTGQFCNDPAADLDYDLRSEDRFIQRLNESSLDDPCLNFFRTCSHRIRDFEDGSRRRSADVNSIRPDLRSPARPLSRKVTPNRHT